MGRGLMASSFDIEVGGSWTLSVREVWPDKDAPEDPTTQDVIAEIKKSGSIRRLIQDWDLNPDTVTVDGVKVDIR